MEQGSTTKSPGRRSHNRSSEAVYLRGSISKTTEEHRGCRRVAYDWSARLPSNCQTLYLLNSHEEFHNREWTRMDANRQSASRCLTTDCLITRISFLIVPRGFRPEPAYASATAGQAGDCDCQRFNDETLHTTFAL